MLNPKLALLNLHYLTSPPQLGHSLSNLYSRPCLQRWRSDSDDRLQFARLVLLSCFLALLMALLLPHNDQPALARSRRMERRVTREIQIRYPAHSNSSMSHQNLRSGGQADPPEPSAEDYRQRSSEDSDATTSLPDTRRQDSAGETVDKSLGEQR